MTASYVIQPEDSYVRTELYFKNGTTLYLNPITRHESDDVVKQRLDHINWFKTIMLWTVYAFVIAIVSYLIVKKTKR